jgi:Spy/CpxP family protein refolding chaperone
MKWIAAVWLVVVTLGLADGHEKHSLSKDLSYLQLGLEQQNDVKEILKAYRHELKAFRDEKERIEKQKERLFAQEKLDEAALGSLHEALSAKASQVEAHFLMQMHRVLSPAQREKFAHNLEEWEVE